MSSEINHTRGGENIWAGLSFVTIHSGTMIENCVVFVLQILVLVTLLRKVFTAKFCGAQNSDSQCCALFNSSVLQFGLMWGKSISQKWALGSRLDHLLALMSHP